MPEVSWSELDALRQCQYKHQLAWLERWRPTRESPALLRGRIMHQVLSCHYGTQRRIPMRLGGSRSRGPVLAVATHGEGNQEHLPAQRADRSAGALEGRALDR
jgi:hypothetical protein